MEPQTRRGILTSSQIKIALNYYSTRYSLESLSKHFGVGKSSIYRCIISVSSALTDIIQEYVSFPDASNEQEINATKSGFWDYGGFPNCLGMVDGTQIKIKAPHQNEEIFVNRKGYHLINAKIVDLFVIGCVVKWPGSVHDSTVWGDSSTRHEIENNYSGMSNDRVDDW